MWPRYETVVQHRWHDARRAVAARFNVATVRDRGATRAGPSFSQVRSRFNVATVRDRGATAPVEFASRPPPPSRERHRTLSTVPAEFGRLREPRVHGGWS